MKCCEYAQGFIFTTLHFITTNEWAQNAGVLHCAILERLAKDEHSNVFFTKKRKCYEYAPGAIFISFVT
jgi:hypothetical protein